MEDFLVVVIGKDRQIAESKARFAHLPESKLRCYHSHTEALAYGKLQKDSIFFDFSIEDKANILNFYDQFQLRALFVNAPFYEIKELITNHNWDLPFPVYGFNGLPTFFNKPLLELSIGHRGSESDLQECLQLIGAEARIVNDRVGMVTPRVIAMIINEAFYTLQEKTATKEDIDSSMKLGTNYPYGPFEWCELIGIQYVYRLLDVLYKDTKDDRYKICPLLKSTYYQNIIDKNSI